jgi:hypothetical protein
MPLAAMPAARRPDPDYAWLAATPEDTAILEWPGDGFEGATTYMLAALHHRRRLMNGYSGFGVDFPVVNRFPRPEALATLADAGVRYVVVHEDRLRDDESRALVAEWSANPALAARREGRTLVLTVPPEAGSPERVPSDPVVPREFWRVTSGQDAIADGRLDTHWVVEDPDDPNVVRIEFDGVWSLTGVVLELGPHLLEYPRGWLLRGGLHKLKPRRMARDPHAVPPLRSYRRDHRHVRVVIPVDPPQGVRAIELRRIGHPGPFGIHEITLHGTRIGTPPPPASRPPVTGGGGSPAPPRL